MPKYLLISIWFRPLMLAILFAIILIWAIALMSKVIMHYYIKLLRVLFYFLQILFFLCFLCFFIINIHCTRMITTSGHRLQMFWFQFKIKFFECTMPKTRLSRTDSKSRIAFFFNNPFKILNCMSFSPIPYTLDIPLSTHI